MYFEQQLHDVTARNILNTVTEENINVIKDESDRVHEKIMNMPTWRMRRINFMKK